MSRDLTALEYVIRKNNWRRAIDKASQHPIVKEIHENVYRYKITYKTGINERWYKTRHQTFWSFPLPFDPLDGKPLYIRNEFPIDPLSPIKDKMEKLWFIGWREFRSACFIDQRLIVQEMIDRICNEGWEKIQYPGISAAEDYKRLLNFDLDRLTMFKGRLILYPLGLGSIKSWPGQIVMGSFTPWEDSFEDAWSAPKALYRAVFKCLLFKKDLTRNRLMRALSVWPFEKYRHGYPFMSPAVYRQMLRLFDIEGMSIVDPMPFFGFKAVAATMQGCSYHSPNQFEPLAQFLGTKYYPIEDKSYDCALLDYGFNMPLNLRESLDEWRERADIVIAYVSKDRVNQMPKPDRRILIENDFGRMSEPNHLFYYI